MGAKNFYAKSLAQKILRKKLSEKLFKRKIIENFLSNENNSDSLTRINEINTFYFDFIQVFVFKEF